MKNAIAILSQYKNVITEQELDERLPSFGKELVMLWDIAIGRKQGYGQYQMSVEFKVGSVSKTFKVHTTDAELFDMEDTDEQYKIILDRVLDACSDDITEWAEELNPYVHFEIVKADGNGYRLSGIEVKKEYQDLQEAAADYVKVLESINERSLGTARDQENWLPEYSPKPSEVFEVEIRKYVNYNWEDFKTEDFSEKTLEILSSKGINPQAPTWIISEQYLIEN